MSLERICSKTVVTISSDASVLEAAYAYEKASDWHKRRPPLTQVSKG